MVHYNIGEEDAFLVSIGDDADGINSLNHRLLATSIDLTFPKDSVLSNQKD